MGRDLGSFLSETKKYASFEPIYYKNNEKLQLTLEKMPWEIKN